MVNSIEKLFNEMLNQILTEKQECKHANDGEFKNDELMNELACMKNKLREANDTIILLQSINQDLKKRYEGLLNDNHELINNVTLLSKLLSINYNNG